MMKLHRSASRSYSPTSRLGNEAHGGGTCCLEDSEASTTTTEDDEDQVHPNSKQTGRLSHKKVHPHDSPYYKTLVCFAFSAVLVFLTLVHAYGTTLFQSSRQATTPTSMSTYAGFLRFGGGSGGDTCPIPQWKYPDCRPFLKLQNATPPLSQEQWQRYRQAYYDAVGPEASTLDPSWNMGVEKNDKEQPTTATTARLSNSWHIPVEVKSSPGKGRGVFTLTRVKAGQQLWDSRYTARFPDECSVREFFAKLGNDEDACNALTWGYVNDYVGHGLEFLLDLDEGVYLNDVSGHHQQRANVINRFLQETTTATATLQQHTAATATTASQAKLEALYAQRRAPSSFGIFATQDMEPGTELLMDYNHVHIPGKLYWYDMLCLKTRGIWEWLIQI